MVSFLFTKVIKAFVLVNYVDATIGILPICSESKLLNQTKHQHWYQETRSGDTATYEMSSILVRPVTKFMTREIQASQNSCSHGTVFLYDVANVNATHFLRDVRNFQDVASDG